LIRKLAVVVTGLAVLLPSEQLIARDETLTGYETWLTPSPSLQLYIEELDDRKGLGRIFVPAMTSPGNEPFYAVFQEEELVGEKSMGASFFLTPGSYTVILGTGTLEQRIRREVEIRREETVILKPDWCALTIEVIDETRSYFKQDLQIFRVATLESYGILPFINPELGEQLQTLILPSGLYKVVKRGADFNTYVNFATVLLEPGTYTPYTIVIDSESGDFKGAGILTAAAQLRQRRNWSLFGAVHGHAILTSANDKSSKDIKTNLTILSQFENRLLFDRFPHYYLSNNLLELGALRQEGAKFIIDRDRLQLKNTYVYYLLDWLGGYGRFEVTTHLFPATIQFDPPRDVIFLDLEGREKRQELNDTEVESAPALFPFELKEGLGVNVTPLKTFIARLSLRTGFGFRQTYNRDVYQERKDLERIDTTRNITVTYIERVEDSFRRGLETSLISNLALLRNLIITTDLDVFFPFNEWNKPELDLENFISLGVTKNISIEHTLRIERTPADYDWTIQEQFVSIRFSYFLF